VTWLSLTQHLEDTAGMADILWNRFWPRQLRTFLSSYLVNDETARKIYVFLAGIHDVGKCSPGFEGQVRSTRPDLVERVENAIHDRIPEDAKNKCCRHESTGYIAMDQWLLDHKVNGRIATDLATIIGGHHGVWAENTLNVEGDILEGITRSEGLKAYGNKDQWVKARTNILDKRWNDIIGDTTPDDLFRGVKEIPLGVQSVLTGMVIVADWMASNQNLFHLSMNGRSLTDEDERLLNAWADLALPTPWTLTPNNPFENADHNTLFHDRFDVPKNAIINNLQESALDYAEHNDAGLMIIEAPMGIGKTETALLAAERIARKRGSGGLVFALPTQATANGIFTRLKTWIEKATNGEESLRLLHGQASLNSDVQEMRKKNKWNIRTYGEKDSIRSPDWFSGSKQGILSSFVVSTIDQILMAALQQKHVMLRHAGLAGKIVIVDEVHSSDDYMEVYMERALEWLAALHCPVILMSATLSPSRRSALVTAYARGMSKDNNNITITDNTRDYPIISTYNSDGLKILHPNQDSRHADIAIKPLPFDDLNAPFNMMSNLLSDGGCGAIIHNTVREAQEEYRRFLDNGWKQDEVILFHSRFMPLDRKKIEDEVVSKLGKHGDRPKRLVVIATQVIEQSLDIDFDVMITDLAPIDLILQRSGRLHRHSGRTRPDKVKNPVLYIRGWSTDEENPPYADKIHSMIYSASKLIRAQAVLLGRTTLHIPDDIPELVAESDSPSLIAPDSWSGPLEEADKKLTDDVATEQNKARAYLLRGPWSSRTMMASNDKLMSNNKDKAARAAVRDSESGLDAIALMKHEDGSVSTLYGDDLLNMTNAPDYHDAQDLLLQKIGIPGPISKPWNIDKTLDALEDNYVESWQSSKCPLSGELVLYFDEDRHVELMGYDIYYDRTIGLEYSKKESK
jgi:CRISPR-associated helicase Cas3/CRISPR-associated endonuclease Cas3-HD